jgi:hypothetical protein
MKLSKFLILFLIFILATGCGGGGSGSGSSTPEPVTTPATVPESGSSKAGTTSNTQTPVAEAVINVLPITVNGSLCAANSYPNKPCVSVRVCAPGTSDCRTITDILLDTGSFGLRIFKELLPVTMQQAIGNSGLAECVQFGDGSSLWGSVQTASVTLGNEPAVLVPIQAVSSTFGASTLPTACSNARPTPVAAGFNGILGVGIFAQDCGTACENLANNGRYYSCTGSICSGTRVPLAGQVQNPVSLLPVDNNGVIVQLPAVPLGGAPAIAGNLVLGIDTQSNNSSAGATAYAANQFGYFTTTFSGVSYRSSFIDSGSNGLFFTSPSPSLLPNCAYSSGWFCPPPPPVSFFAANTAVSGEQIRVDFQIGNAGTLFMSENKVFVEIGGNFRGVFDWGLPFFFGRNVYVGIEGRTSSLGSGPYWAY